MEFKKGDRIVCHRIAKEMLSRWDILIGEKGTIKYIGAEEKGVGNIRVLFDNPEIRKQGMDGDKTLWMRPTEIKKIGMTENLRDD